MKKKNAFTLIELLAVIVVLAIIALIATPIVMKTIKNAKKGAAERSADSYIKQVEVAVATSKLDGNEVQDGTYTINDDGNLLVPSLKDGELKIEMSGNRPKGGAVTITNGQATLTSPTEINKLTVTYDSTNKKYVASEKGSTTPDTPTAKTYANGEVVYFNVTTGAKCSDYTESQSNTGVKEGCMKFYAFNDDGGTTVNLILDHNTTAKVAWNDTDKDADGGAINTNGPKEVLDQLKIDTASWKGMLTPNNYTMDQTGQTSNAKYTIDYSDYKARLITTNEVAQIIGDTSWDEKIATDHYHFDSKTSSESDTCKEGNTTGCQYGWLYDRTSIDCTTYGCLNSSSDSYETFGYWTASSCAFNTYGAWNIYYGASLYSEGVDNGGTIDDFGHTYGVRPVITVLKSQLG